MPHRFALPPLGLAILTLSLACGGDSDDDGNASADSTGTDPGSSSGGADNLTDPMTSVESSGAPTSVDSSGTNPGDTTDATVDSSSDGGSSDESGPMPVACQVWEITYDLTGSEFEISNTPAGAGNQVNVVAEPYDDDEHIGPGNIVLRFHDVDGAPGGDAFVSSYDMDLNFVVGGAVTVTTDLLVTGGPSECGLTTGTVAAATVAWAPAAMADIHTMGTILCMGGLCGLGGLPDGKPMPVDEVAEQELNPFVFSAELDSFTMAEVVISMDDQAT